ncbi:MAG: MerR family transcriptional regulator [Actinomycetota bacterium]|nr:MerR family transcriptional regulator [Actinomycetota bacterium]
MQALTVGAAAAQSGWSARMLRYLEQAGLVVPERSSSGYRIYSLRELNQLRSLRDLRDRYSVELDELSFAARLRREPDLRAAVETWLHASVPSADWVDWEQRKHERLLVA